MAILSTRSTSTLVRLFLRTHLWYLRYAFQYLTHPWRAEPTFFLMGFPKCGTTYFCDMLTSLYPIATPTTLAPLGKETFHYRKDQPVYAFMPIKGFYPLWSRENHVVDASVSYSLDPGALTLVKRDYPDTKVILIVRDQVGAIESGINYYNVKLWRPDHDALKIFDDPVVYREFPMEKLYRAIAYAQQHQCSTVVTCRSEEIQALWGHDSQIAGRLLPLVYDRWVSLIQATFGNNNVLVLDFADITHNPKPALIRTAEFLGIEETPKSLDVISQELNKHTTDKVFRLNTESKLAISELFREHNENLKSISGVDLNSRLISAAKARSA